MCYHSQHLDLLIWSSLSLILIIDYSESNCFLAHRDKKVYSLKQVGSVQSIYYYYYYVGVGPTSKGVRLFCLFSFFSYWLAIDLVEGGDRF